MNAFWLPCFPRNFSQLTWNIVFQWVPINTYYLGGGVYVDRCHLFLTKWV